MTRIVLRPTVAEDLAHVTSDELPHRIKAITAVDGENVLAIGGLGFRPDGTVIAFMAMIEEFRKYPVAIHRAGIAGMKLIRECGVKRVFAQAQVGNPAAAPWLLRFGFRECEVAGEKAFVWERAAE